MLLARAALIFQFNRDIQMLRDTLVGLTERQLVDPGFHPETNLQESLALLAAYYFHEGEVLAHKSGRQFDPPLDPDDIWRADIIRSTEEWTLTGLQSNLENAWEFYAQMLRDVADSEYVSYVQYHNGNVPRFAHELSRKIASWRMRSEG